jgi:acyl-CoA reductase-like NAD-dependent aldehyde dehydrogenase
VTRTGYHEWYDWARRELGGDNARLHAATEAALDALESGMTADGAAAAARQRAAQFRASWAEVSPADRRSILSQRVDWYARAGFQVTVMSDTTAQMMRPKHIDTTLVIVLAIISIFAFFIPIVIYLIWYAMRKPDMLSIQVDEYGQVHEQAFRL